MYFDFNRISALKISRFNSVYLFDYNFDICNCGCYCLWRCGTTSFATNPSKRRRTRRQRSTARRLLWLRRVGWLTLTPQRISTIRHRLGLHHSVDKKQQRNLERMEQGLSKDPWKCAPCKRLNKQSALFCGACGLQWQQCWDKTYQHRSTYATDSTTWQNWTDDTWEQRPKSPRRRQARSPRTKGKADGKGKSNNPQNSSWTGQRTSKWPAPVLDFSQIKETNPPEPSQAKPLAVSKPPESSAEVQELIATLQASYPEGLPPEIQSKVDKIKKTSPMDLRRHISQMTKVKKELDSLREARKRHMDSWKLHVESLIKNTKAQHTQYQNVIQDFRACEEELMSQFQQARTAIFHITQQSKPAEADLEALNAVDASMVAGTQMEPINVEEETDLAMEANEEAARLQQIQATLNECVASLGTARDRSRSRGRGETTEPATKTTPKVEGVL